MAFLRIGSYKLTFLFNRNEKGLPISKNCVRFFVMENEGSTLTKRGERTSTLLIKGNSSLTSSNHFTCSLGEGEGLFCLIKPKPQTSNKKILGQTKTLGN